MTGLTVIPLTLAQARGYVTAHHRHHRPPQGHKFSIGAVTEGGALAGVAIIGRPVARAYDDGLTAEVTRLATDGTPNACSALYGAAWRTARGMGYRRLITYTQADESGASLRAVGWRRAAELSPRRGWDTPSRRREDRGTDRVARVLWEIVTADAGPTPLPGNGICNEIPCEQCGTPMPLRPGRGRPRRTCSPRCRTRAHRVTTASAPSV
ncbi:XF1762 family protein [Kitasatospora cineracea]